MRFLKHLSASLVLIVVFLTTAYIGTNYQSFSFQGEKHMLVSIAFLVVIFFGYYLGSLFRSKSILLTTSIIYFLIIGFTITGSDWYIGVNSSIFILLSFVIIKYWDEMK